VSRWTRRHPAYGAVALAVTAWVAVLDLHGRLGHAGHGAEQATLVGPGQVHAGHLHAAGGAVVLGGPYTLSPVISEDLPMWALMCVAMMVPAVLPAVNHVGVNTLRWRRQRAIATFLVAYLFVWWGFGLVVLPVLHLLDDRLRPWQLTAGAALLAAGWLVTPALVYCRRACHRTVPLPPRGRRAVEGCVRFGLVHGLACVGVCGPLMLLMATLLHAQVVWMVVLTALVLANKLLPRRLRPGAVRLPARVMRPSRAVGTARPS
jgi:predicted metal-binding membrane protein